MCRRMHWIPLILVLISHATLLVHADEPKRGLAALSVPEGFVVEVVAGPPVTERPLMGGFDDRGRLYLAESAGLNLDAKELLQQTPNFIRRLEDADGDGRFESSTLFADKMTFPMGALWHRGVVYSASPPYIWKLIDDDDDGVCDRREILVGKFGFIGNAADIHGCFLAPNGRIYWCDGRHGHEFVDENGNVQSVGKAARIFSAWPDGSDVQSLAGGGMDNPVEVDFEPTGEVLGVVNLFYPKRGDCLVHWLHGGVYPRQDQPVQIAEFKRTGDLLGPVHDFGHVAVSGSLRYRSRRLDPAWQGNWFVTQFNTHKLVRVELSRSGSSYTAATHEFLSSSDPDFHPTDVIEDADGSLLVVDTGGWFRNGCPTSQIAKPEVTGAIYRIRRAAAPRLADPRGATLAWDEAPAAELIKRLIDDRPAVRARAIDTLAQQIESDADVRRAVAENWSGRTPEQRVALVWSLARARADVPASVLDDADPSVRQAAAVATQFSLDRRLAPALLSHLSGDESPAVRRESAVALGKMKVADAVPTLLAALKSASGDRSLEHAVLYALIEIDDRAGTAAGLASTNSQVRRGALLALDQMPSGGLTRDEVAPLLDTEDRALQQTALDVIARRPGWGGEILGRFREWLAADSIDPERVASIRGPLLAFAKEPEIEALVGELLASEQTSGPARRILLEVVARDPRKPCPESWHAGVKRSLASSDVDELMGAIAATRGSEEFFLQELTDAALGESRPLANRQAAAASVARSQKPVDAPIWKILVAGLDAAGAPLDRMAVAEAIGMAQLSPEQLHDLVRLVAAAGPIELPSLVRAFERPPSSQELGLALLSALDRSPGRSSLSPGRWSEVFSSYPEPVRKALSELLARTAVTDSEWAGRLSALEREASAGQPQHGKEVFFGTRASCAACHAVAGEGGRIGPDLSKIGASRTARDLVESILRPSASLARGFESYQVVTASGTVHSGIIAQESLDTIWLRTADRSEIPLRRDEIEELAPSARSVMPEGLDQLLTRQEVSDLVAFLVSLR